MYLSRVGKIYSPTHFSELGVACLKIAATLVEDESEHDLRWEAIIEAAIDRPVSQMDPAELRFKKTRMSLRELDILDFLRFQLHPVTVYDRLLNLMAQWDYYEAHWLSDLFHTMTPEH